VCPDALFFCRGASFSSQIARTVPLATRPESPEEHGNPIRGPAAARFTVKSAPDGPLAKDNWRMRRVGDPASRSWSPRPVIGSWRFWPGRWAPQCARILTWLLRRPRKRPQSRDVPTILETVLEWRHQDLSVRCVCDESSRVFLGVALQQSPPLRRPTSMLGQFSVGVNRKDESLSFTGAAGPLRSS
jgi:hypothetical protein